MNFFMHILRSMNKWQDFKMSGFKLANKSSRLYQSPRQKPQEKGDGTMFTRISDIDRMFGAMDLLRNKMDRIFGDFDRSYDYWPGLTLKSNSPRTNLYEEGESFEIRAEVPGIAKEDLNVKIQGNYLEISGSRSRKIPEGYKIHRSEREADTFLRSFTLPNDIDSEKVEASLKDGILYLKLPKSEAAKPKQIAIG